MSNGEIYAPAYLRKQSDSMLHGIADMIEKQVENLQSLRVTVEKLELEKAFIIEYLNPKDLSFRYMIDNFMKLDEDQKSKLINLSESLAAFGSRKETTK